MVCEASDAVDIDSLVSDFLDDFSNVDAEMPVRDEFPDRDETMLMAAELLCSTCFRTIGASPRPTIWMVTH